MVADKARTPGGNPLMHRLQIGIGGIFAVLVMVALADMLLQRAATDLLVWARSAGVELRRLDVRSASLEEAFLTIAKDASAVAPHGVTTEEYAA